jgi:signal transduction histidine kinase
VIAVATGSQPLSSGAASIFHDLRNPLATIHASAQLLAREELSPAQIRRIARNVYSASSRMGALLEELLDRNTGCEMHKQATDVRALVECAVDTIAITAEFQGVAIEQDVPAGLIADLDWRRVKSVLVNLLVNALEVMPSGGAIRITAAAERDSVLAQVRDTGPGIAPEIQDRIFEPFVTAGKPRGGEIWAESSPRGACFSFRLPLTTDPRRHASR